MFTLSKYKVSFWHQVAHWLGLAREFCDVYCKEDGDNVYMCFRCEHCNNAREEMVIGTKAIFLSPLASFHEDI